MTGVFEEEINGTEISVLYRTYAHQYYNRILVTDITLTRTGINNDDLTVQKANNVSDSTTDINFEEPEIYNETYR